MSMYCEYHNLSAFGIVHQNPKLCILRYQTT